MVSMLKDKVTGFSLEKGLIEEKDRILVGFSGGSDSLCLLHVLLEMKEEMGLTLGACHINHLLRGADADKDEEFARRTAEEMGIPFYVKRADAALYAREKGVSSEVAGREIRYGFFEETMDANGYNKCALAHNLNDQGETILLNIIRGTGLSGLTGISAKRESYIRPLLSTERWEIEAYLEARGLTGCMDATNEENVYSRNKIRNVIIPFVRENFNEDFPNTLYRMAELLDEDNSFIETCVKEAEVKYIIEKKYEVLIKKEAFHLKKAVLGRLILQAIRLVKGNISNIERVHVEKIIELSAKETGKIIDVKEDITAYNNYGDVYIKSKNILDPSIISPLKEKAYTVPGTYYFKDCRVTMEILDKMPERRDRAYRYFDLDATGTVVRIRNRVHGDRIKPLGMTGYKKLKDIFIDKKINRDLRNSLLVFLKDDEVFYIGDTVTGEDFKVTDKTKRILAIGIFWEVINSNDSK